MRSTVDLPPAPVPGPGAPGALERYEHFPSQHIAGRAVEVWLPPGYASGGAARYPVLYMHDGQNLFRRETAYGGVAWDIHQAAADLMATGEIPGVIIVGVANAGPDRWREYLPQKPAETEAGQVHARRFADRLTGASIADAYLRCLVSELKPFIDERYRTRPEQPQTCVMGSSMGGLISLYALCEYPQIFGGAGCVSTHWVAGEQFLVDYFAGVLPPPGAHRLYFDFGTETLDAAYEPWQAQMDAHLRRIGYAAGRDWITRKFPGAEHAERSWRERAQVPLAFLFGHGRPLSPFRSSSLSKDTP